MPNLIIGSRGSMLALWQSNWIKAKLEESHPGLNVSIEIIKTTGDKLTEASLVKIGGKGVFTKEIEEALLAGEVDVAVHSGKDLPTWLPAGLMLAGCLEREDVRDVFLSRKAKNPRDLAHGARVGTASLRRQAMMKRLRPDLHVENFRGNVETRLRKLDDGIVDATLLALAGLRRLGYADLATCILPVEEFPPAVAQGAIALECREGDARTHALLGAITHADTSLAIDVERAFLAALEGSCRTPIAGHAQIVAGRVRFRGLILRPDGSEVHETTREGALAEAVALGADAGEELKRRAPADFFAQ